MVRRGCGRISGRPCVTRCPAVCCSPSNVCRRASRSRIAVHLDIWTSDLHSDIDRLVAAGGETVGGIVDEDDDPFQIMQDPEGNEFCLVT